MTKLLSLDLETTGLHPHSDMILEVGCMFFDTESLVQGQASWLVKPCREFRTDDFVTKMYNDNGLFVDLNLAPNGVCEDIRLPAYPPDALSHKEIQGAVIGWLEQFTEAKETLMVGRSIASLEFPFLRRYAPQLLNFLSHRSIDVSSLEQMAKIFGGELPEQIKPDNIHRALPDAVAAMANLNAYGLDRFQ